jgi:integrase
MVKVTISEWGDNRPLMLRWIDPETGRRRAKSSGTRNQGKAERAAALLQKDLDEGKYSTASKISWQDFTWRYSDEVLPGLAKKTRDQLGTIFNTVERLCNPAKLADVTAARLSGLAAKLRAEGKAEITIRNYLAHLRASFRWAADLGILRLMPKFPKLQRAKGSKVMKGRPISGEELERMLAVVPKVLAGQDKQPSKPSPTPDKPKRKPSKPRPERTADPTAVTSWVYYLKGLWWSGLRLRESVALSWDERAGLSVDLSGKFPMLRIRADSQKSGKDQIYPLAPEFGEMLLAVPEDQRHGRVFKLLGSINPYGGPAVVGPVTDPDYVSHVVSRIGQASGVKVDAKTKTDRKTGKPGETIKYASCHDLRRSFGFRWSRRIMPAELQELMRHEDIQTTMRFYVGANAQSTAANLWTAYGKATKNEVGNTLATIEKNQSGKQPQETTQALISQGLAKRTPQDSNL